MFLRSRTVLSLSLPLLLVSSAGAVAQSEPEPLVISEDGAVIEDLVTDQKLLVLANDVTLINVVADRVMQRRPFEGLTVIDSVFAGSDPADNIGAVLQPDTLFDNVIITGHKDGLYIETGGSVTVRDSLIDIRSDLPDNHSDGITLPFAQNFNGEADFVVENTTVWAEGKTAAFNQQGLPLNVVNSVWSGSVYAAEGSRYSGAAQNPDDVRIFGRPVPWEVPRETFDALVDYDVSLLTDTAEILAGDFTGDGEVSQADLNLVLGSWGRVADVATGPLADRPSGIMDQAELNRVLSHWGERTAGAPGLSGYAVPEPAGAAVLGLIGGVLLRRRRG
jgi:hypothetical protein